MKKKNNYTPKEAEQLFKNGAWPNILKKYEKFLLIDEDVTNDLK